jgi:hypothetical protein
VQDAAQDAANKAAEKYARKMLYSKLTETPQKRKAAKKTMCSNKL